MALKDKDEEDNQQSVLTLLTEIIVEILSRLPVDSLLRCKSVCKSWRSLISNPRFINSHLKLSIRHNHYAHHHLIFSTKQGNAIKTSHLFDVMYDHGSSVGPLEVDYPLKHPRKSVWIIGTCNGLVCIGIEGEACLFIWNPSTRMSYRLPRNAHTGRIYWSHHYGFGYDESSDDYKLVEMCVKFKELKYETSVLIYSLRDGSWKNAGRFPHGMPLDFSATYLNGALHWGADNDVACDYSAKRLDGVVRRPFDWYIIYLDLAKGTYGEVLQPMYDEGDYNDLSLGSLRERLCVLCNYHRVRADLWVMKEYGVEDSWTKLVSIPYLTDPGLDMFSMPLCIINDGKVLLELGWKLVVYDSKNNSFSEIQKFDECDFVFTFVESLVSPMPTAGAEKSNQLIEILSRLPVDSLLRCRSVCKSWRSLISDPRFINSHLKLSTRHNYYAHHHLIFSTKLGNALKTSHLYDVMYDNSISPLELDSPLKHPRKSVWIIGTCNGLVCIGIEGEDCLYIWNPCTRMSKRLPCNDHTGKTYWSRHYGFGYEESSDDYKLVEMCVKFKESKYETSVLIYSLRDGSWKNAGTFPHGMPLDFSATFLNGALHWGADNNVTFDYSAKRSNGVGQGPFDWYIIYMDLANETYGEILQPMYDEGDYNDLRLGSLREQLCVLCNYRRIRADLWVMKEYGDEDSWTKLVSIPYLTDPGLDRFSMPLCISNDGKVLLELGWKLVVYDSRNISFSEMQKFGDCDNVFTFVESLVSPMPAAGSEATTAVIASS